MRKKNIQANANKHYTFKNIQRFQVFLKKNTSFFPKYTLKKVNPKINVRICHTSEVKLVIVIPKAKASILTVLYISEKALKSHRGKLGENRAETGWIVNNILSCSTTKRILQ